MTHSHSAPREVPSDCNALSPGLWPQSLHRDAAGVLRMADLPLPDLVARFGSPVQVLDEADVRSRAVALRAAFEAAATRAHTTVSIFYASKALLVGAVTRWMLEAGFGIDVCTGGELAVALAAGAPASRLAFHGNNKSREELTAAVAAGVGSIVVDHPDEIAHIDAFARSAGRVQDVLLRVRSGVHASTHEFLATAHEDQKFGVSLDDVASLVADIRSRSGLRFLGLHCHIGSQIFGPDGFVESARRLVATHAALCRVAPVPELNLGGGFGIAYTETDRPDALAVMAEAIVSVVADACHEAEVQVPRLAFEPGRYLVGPAGITVYTVGVIKAVSVADGQRTYVSVDGGMSDNPRPALYQARYSARLANRWSDAGGLSVRVAGKHCEAGDILIDEEILPADIHTGDLLAVAATGAYSQPLSSNYNHVPRPGLVTVRDGIATEVIRRETVDDLMRRDRSLAAFPDRGPTASCPPDSKPTTPHAKESA